MNLRILVLLVLPLVVQCFECIEELESQTRTVIEPTYREEWLTYTRLNETFIENSTILCSHLDPQSGDKEPFLRIIGSNISTPPTVPCSRFTRLYKLDLGHIYAKFIEPEAFRSVTKLRELYLNENELTVVTKGVFNSLHELEILDLSINRIETIEISAFTGLDNLRHLFLSGNLLGKIDGNIFKPLKNLQILDLSSNILENVDFYEIPQCEKVDFSNNRISLVENLDFLIISDLDLSNNNLKYVNGTISNVKKLTISNNELETFNLQFINCQQLSYINLAFNQISSFETYIFQGLISLNFLDLTHNNLNLIQPDLFTDLQNLVNLNLSYNHIERFQFGTFDGFTMLRDLDISHNRLGELNEYIFNSMSHSLESLNFESNQISSLDVTYFFTNFRNLRTIYLADNLWKCQDLASISQRFPQKLVRFEDQRNDIENINGVACKSQTSERSLKKFVKLVNTSIDNSNFVKFFNSSYRKTNFFQYFDNFARDDVLREDNFSSQKLISAPPPTMDYDRFIICLLVLNVLTLFTVMYVLVLKKKRQNVKPTALTTV